MAEEEIDSLSEGYIGTFGCEPDENQPKLPSHLWQDGHIHTNPGCECGKETKFLHIIIDPDHSGSMAGILPHLVSQLAHHDINIIVVEEEPKPLLRELELKVIDILPTVLEEDKRQKVQKEFFVPKHILNRKNRKKRRR